MNREYLIGVDFGGTNIRAGLIDLAGKLMKKFELPTDAKKGKKQVIENLILAIEKVKKEGVIGVGIACPGPLDSRRTMLLDPPNLPGWKETPLKKIVEERLKIPVFLDNDANCFAIAESKCGEGRKTKNLIAVTLGTGIGTGIIIDNKLYAGENGAAGELGHMTVEADGLKCTCGNFGCWEMYVSAKGIKARYELLKGKAAPEVPEIIKMAKSDNELKELINETGIYLGIGLANIINIFDPGMIILSGGISNIKALLPIALKEAKKRAFTPAGKRTEIIITKMEDPIIIGAASIIK